MNIGKSQRILVLSAIALGFQCCEQAQAGFLNLADWTWGEPYVLPPNVQVFAPPHYSVSADSANFSAGWGYYTNGSSTSIPLQPPTLYGSIATTPGAIYEISFSILDGSGSFGGNFSFAFGNITTNLSLFAPFGSVTRNIDFTAIAESTATALSVSAAFNDFFTPSAQFYNFSVTPVPESSTAELLGLGGCIWLFVQQSRRFFPRQRRK